MHVIIIILLLILLWVAITNWHITVPLLAFLCYLGCLTVWTPQQRRSPLRHILWWSFLILLSVGIYHRESISRFTSDVHFENARWHTDYILEHSLQFDEDLAPLTDSPSPSPEELYGGLHPGMSPLHCVWHLTRHKELSSNLHLDSIYLSLMSRHYSDNRLYGISFNVYSRHDSVDIHQQATDFFSRKYGNPHHQGTSDEHRITSWKFAEKHILLVFSQQSREGYLFIYHPQMLQQKIDAHHEEEARKQAEIEAIIKQREEEKRQLQESLLEETKRREQENLRLRESL